MKKYEQIKRIGSGAFGDVILMRHRPTQNLCAAKKLKCDTTEKQDDAMQEIVVLSQMEHKFIVQIKDAVSTQERGATYVWLIMDYCNKGTLNEYMLERKRNRMRNNHLKSTLMTQMADAITFLHDRNIVHRDLKPDNILIIKQKGEIWAKVADFGLAKVAECIGGKNYLDTMCGTPLFMAPEMGIVDFYDEKVDIFSLGVIFLALITNSTCRGNLEYYYKDYSIRTSLGLALQTFKRYKPILPNDLKLSPELKEAIISMVAYKPRKRPDAETILIMFTCEENAAAVASGTLTGYEATNDQKDESSDEDESPYGERGGRHKEDVDRLARRNPEGYRHTGEAGKGIDPTPGGRFEWEYERMVRDIADCRLMDEEEAATRVMTRGGRLPRVMDDTDYKVPRRMGAKSRVGRRYLDVDHRYETPSSPHGRKVEQLRSADWTPEERRHRHRTARY